MKKIFLYIIVVASVLIVVYTQTTFNFGFLAIWYILVIVFAAFAMHWLQKKEYDEDVPLMSARRIAAILSAMSIFILGILSLKALENYFYASPKVYTNADHNALRLDGISIGRPDGFVLAGNARNAFFDDPTMQGHISIVSVEDNTVRLRLDNFTRPLFKVSYDVKNDKKEFKYSVLGTGKTLFHFTDKDTLTWCTNKKDVWKLKFCPDRKEDVKFGLLSEYVDIMRYHVYSPDSMEMISNDSIVLKQGTRFDQITCGTAADRLNLSWLHIVRDTGYVSVKNDERLATFDNIGYNLAIDNFLRVDGEEYPVAFTVDGHQWYNVGTSLSEEIEVPFDSVFVIGYGSNRTKPVYFTMDSGTLELRYRMPVYRYLSHGNDECRDSMLIISSRQQLLDVIDKAADNVATFEVFDRMDNIYNMQPQLISYSIGCTSDSLDLSIGKLGESQAPWVGIKQVPTAISTKNDVKWLLCREDFKTTSHCQPRTIKLYICILMVLFVALLLLGAFFQKVTTTSVEFVAYAASLFLITLRWFLLWRSSVFLPVSSVSWFEFESLFRNPDNVFYIKIVPILACALFAVAKIVFIPRCGNSFMWFGALTNKIKWLCCNKVKTFLVFYGLSFVISIALKNKPWLAITVPALLYLISTALITYMFSGKYDKDEASIVEFSTYHRSTKLLICSAMNVVIFSIIYAIIDTGYSIIFLTFCLFWLLWLLYDHVVCYLQEDAYRYRIVAILIVFGCGILLIGFYKDVFGLLYNHTSCAMAIFAVVSFLLFGLIAFAVAVRNWFSSRLLWPWVITVLVMTFIPYGIKKGMDSLAPHTVARIMVHFSDADEITRKIDHLANERRFYQAASNHAIIREYAERGDDVNLFGEGGKGYFKMQPHSKVGAMWGAQLTDISIVRYVIAEHSPWLPLLVNVLFLLMLWSAAAQPKYERWTRALLIQIPLLLTVQSLLIWMATTGRFIFLGQDFPMLSINSRLVLVFYFSLIVVWVVVASFSQARLRYTADEEYSVLKWRDSIGKKDARKLLVVIGSCLFLGWAAKPTQSTALSDLTAKKSRLDNTVAQLDSMLLAFQKDSAVWIAHPELRKKYASIIVDNSGRNNKFYRFKMQSNLRPFFCIFDSLRVRSSNVFDDNPLAKELWDNYVNKDSKHNDLSQIIHARMSRDGRLQLVLKYNFYNQHLPTPVGQQWKGNLISSYTNNQNRYWARNFQINGQRELIYPYGREFFWIRTFGSELMAQRCQMLKKDDSQLNEDVEVSLSPSLNSKLTTIMRGCGEGACVIVANGDGEVWAISELKNNKYRLDPNNNRALQRFADSLELYGCRGGKEERMVYGNANLKQISHGPGSSQKPLVWTAIASQLKGFDWEHFAVASYNQKANTAGNKFLFEKFAGQRFLRNQPFRPLKNPDENNGNMVTLDGFMSHSSNVYNAIMAYIGSFTREQLRQPEMLILDTMLSDGTPSLFRSYSSNDKNSFREFFPIMQNEKGEKMVFNRNLDSSIQDHCLLNESMSEMFFSGTENDLANNKGDYDTTAPEFLASCKKISKDSTVEIIYNRYAYVERSKFQSRGNSISHENLMEHAIRSTAIGAGNVWRITPWKMAESFGRMASLNSNLHIGIVKQPKPGYRLFSFISDDYKTARLTQMLGMRNVFFSSSNKCNGTAYRMKSMLNITDDGSIVINGRRFYIYGKTGTTNDYYGNDKHRIGIIIADRDLTTTEIKDLAKVRYVTMYFTMPGGAKWKIYSDVITGVMNSVEFQKYMFQKY